jgi:hypothetical protein
MSAAGVGKWVPVSSSAARVMALLAPFKDGGLGTASRVGLGAALQSLVPIWRPQALNLQFATCSLFIHCTIVSAPIFWNCTFTPQLVIFFVAL